MGEGLGVWGWGLGLVCLIGIEGDGFRVSVSAFSKPILELMRSIVISSKSNKSIYRPFEHAISPTYRSEMSLSTTTTPITIRWNYLR